MYMDQSSIYNLLCSLLININNSMVFEMDTHLHTSKGSFTFWVWIPDIQKIKPSISPSAKILSLYFYLYFADN